jgi:hypothetical protein
MNWITLLEDKHETFPDEGIEVLVTDGTNYDVAWYLMSSTYEWRKTDLEEDTTKKFNAFKITKWSYID